MPPTWITRTARFMAPFMAMCAILFTHQSYAGVTTWTAPAPTASALGNWATFAADGANWVDWPGTITPTPKDNFRLLGEIEWNKPTGSFDIRMFDKESWLTLGRASVGQFGMGANDVSDVVKRFPSNSAYVFAAYSPENAELHVEVHKVERTPDGMVRTYVADFTPWHGERWKAFGTYRTPAENLAGVAGHNPFGNFQGADVTDPLFHKISFSGAQVVVGHAMRHYGAVMGFLAPSQNRFDVKSSTSGGMFQKKTKTTVAGYTSIRDWYVATPIDLQSDGAITAGICVLPSSAADDTCDAPEHVATAGVMFTKWSGGNMPGAGQEEKIYEWTQTKKSFTVAFFAVVIAVVTMGAGLVLMGPAAGMATAGTAVGGSTLVSVGSGAILNLGAAAFVGYSALATSGVLGGGGSLTSSQRQVFGTTGNGVVEVDPAADGEHSAGLAAGIHNRHIAPTQGNNLNGMELLWNGTCPENQTVAQCRAAGLDPGMMWRPDTYKDYNTTLEMRQRWDTCQAQNLSGAALRQCVAPGYQGTWP